MPTLFVPSAFYTCQSDEKLVFLTVLPKDNTVYHQFPIRYRIRFIIGVHRDDGSTLYHLETHADAVKYESRWKLTYAKFLATPTG